MENHLNQGVNSQVCMKFYHGKMIKTNNTKTKLFKWDKLILLKIINHYQWKSLCNAKAFLLKILWNIKTWVIFLIKKMLKLSVIIQIEIKIRQLKKWT